MRFAGRSAAPSSGRPHCSAWSRTWSAARSREARRTSSPPSSGSRCWRAYHSIPATTCGKTSSRSSGARCEQFRIPHSAFRTMKFLCVECDRQMQFEERQLPGDGTLAAAFRCPTCGRVVALLTNLMETQLVASLGVKIGSTTRPTQPLETVRGMVATGKEDAFDDGRERGAGSDPSWSMEAQERLARVPGFVRGMVKRIYLDYAKDRGIAEITPAVMDTARSELGLGGM